MKTLKKIGIGLIVLLLILLVISFFLPSKIKVERSIVVKASADTIFKQINNFKNWEQWSPWQNIDPDMETVYSENAEGVGATSQWKSKNPNVGYGRMEITASTPNESVVLSIDFTGHGVSTGYFNITPEGEDTKVVWSMDMDMGTNPISKYFGLMMDRMIGRDFEKGLVSIKELCEIRPPAQEIVVEEKEIVPFNYISIIDSVAADKLGNHLGELYGELMGYLAKNNLEQISEGGVFAFYHSYTPEKVVFEAGLKINKAAKSSGRILSGEITTGKAAVVYYHGAYEESGNAHSAIDEWLPANGKSLDGGRCWEVYVTDPNTEADTSKWLTEIWYPIK